MKGQSQSLNDLHEHLETRVNDLESLWRKLEEGSATVEDKIEAVVLASEKKDLNSAHYLVELTQDPADEVRSMALEALVFELKINTNEVADLCWNILRHDLDDHVRFIAAAGLARLFHGSYRLDIFEKLMTSMLNEPEDSYVRLSIFNAIIRIVGAPPSEWLGVKLPRERLIGGTAVDFSKIKQIEELLRRREW